MQTKLSAIWSHPFHSTEPFFPKKPWLNRGRTKGTSVPSSHVTSACTDITGDLLLLETLPSSAPGFPKLPGNDILPGRLSGSVPQGLVPSPHLFSPFTSLPEWSHLLPHTDKTHISISRPGLSLNFRFCFPTLMNYSTLQTSDISKLTYPKFTIPHAVVLNLSCFLQVPPWWTPCHHLFSHLSQKH